MKELFEEFLRKPQKLFRGYFTIPGGTVSRRYPSTQEILMSAALPSLGTHGRTIAPIASSILFSDAMIRSRDPLVGFFKIVIIASWNRSNPSYAEPAWNQTN